jgi:hypothetical protein
MDGNKISIVQAEKLRKESANGELSAEAIEQLLKPETDKPKRKQIKLSTDFLSEFFDDDKSEEDIQATVAEALRMYLNR